MPKNTAEATWTGGLKDGEGHVVSGHKGVDVAFSFKSRFEEGEGTNPEELIGAAHAGCFSMQFSAFLHEDGIESESVKTSAEVTLKPIDGTPTITAIALDAVVTAPGADADKVNEIGQKAKDACPLSRALAAVDEITLNVTVA